MAAFPPGSRDVARPPAMNGRWPSCPVSTIRCCGSAGPRSYPCPGRSTSPTPTRSEDLLSVLNQGAALLIADLSKTTFCDSAGVSALARSFRRAEASESEMRLVVSTLAVQRVLALTGIDRVLDIYPSVAASLAAWPDSGNAAATVDTDGGAA